MKLFLRASLTRVALVLCCAMVSALAAEEKPAVAKKPLPTAKEVLERFSKAIGGKDSFQKHRSQHAIGRVEMPAQKVTGKMDVYAERPDKLLMKLSMQGVGEITTGFNGEVAWMSTALTGPMLLEGKMREQIATQADFDHALHDPADYTTKEVVGIENFNGEECYKLKLVHRTGFDSTEFFSTKTGLQRGFITTQESPFGPITTTTIVTAYKQFGNLFMPSQVSQKAAGMEQVMTIDEMEFDKVDSSVFKLPEDVKALLAEPEEKPDGKDDKAAPGKKPSEKPETKASSGPAASKLKQ